MMANKAVFEGLVYSEDDQLAGITYVGGEACYVVDDGGFLRHIPSEQVDCQVLDAMKNQISDHKEIIGEQTAKMMGQEDIFSRAIIQNQLENIDQQLQHLYEHGLPESAKSYLGMMGFKIIIDVHGQVLQVIQPGMVADEGEED